MSRNESSLLFSLQELRNLEGERVERERAALAAEEQQREATRQQELARKRAAEEERQRLEDALRAAIVERDAQTALARRAVERHSTLALELAEAQLARLNAESRLQEAMPSTPTPPARSRGWIVANGLLAIGSLSLLTATLVFRTAPPPEARTLPIPVPVAIVAPSAAAPTPTPTRTPTPVEPTRPKPPRPHPAKPAATTRAPSCDHNDPICGLGLD